MFWRKKKKDGFKVAFEHAGHKFYIPEDIGNLQTGRAMSFWMAIREFTLHITGKDLDVIQERLKVAINEGNIADAGYLVNVMSAYRMMEASKRTIINVAKYYILLDGEDNDEIDQSILKKKEDLFYAHPEIEAFFLSQTWRLIASLLGLSNDTKIEDYLTEEAEEIEKAFSHLIHGNGT